MRSVSLNIPYRLGFTDANRPYRSGPATAAVSSPVRPVSRELTRTITRRPLRGSLGTHSRAKSLALAFSAGGTESSRSTITMSALNDRARSSILGRLPGTKIKLLNRSNQLLHVPPSIAPLSIYLQGHVQRMGRRHLVEYQLLKSI